MDVLVKSKNIKDTLGLLKINYSWDSFSEEIFKVASLFSKVHNGFYFYSGNEEIEFENSLILVGNNTPKIYGENQIIKLLDAEPQQIYYMILNHIFGRKSNGKIAKTAVIGSKVNLGTNVQIDDFCILEDNVQIGNDVIIGSYTKIHSNSSIGNETIIESGCIIGTQGVAWTWNKEQTQKIIQPQLGGVEVKEKCFIGAGTIIVRGSLNENTEIGFSTLMAPGGRIGHGTKVGNFVHFANNVITGGNTVIGDFSFIGSSAVFRPKVVIHPKTIIGSGSVVVKNTTMAGKTLMGVPAVETLTKIFPSGMPKPKL